jgi:hypothetical protein
MVLKFRLISNEEDDFIRDFEILANQTFFQLHMAIQENLHFDKSQIASFFICSQEWEKEQEITLFELSDEEAAKVITMDNAIIEDHIHQVHHKMIYVFDVFNERLMFIELVDKTKRDPVKEYPLCSYSKGSPPPQLLTDQLFGSGDFSNGIILDDPVLGEDLPDTNGLEDLGLNSELYDDDLLDV